MYQRKYFKYHSIRRNVYFLWQHLCSIADEEKWENFFVYKVPEKKRYICDE